MMVAGVNLKADEVLELTRLLYEAGFDDTANALLVALAAEQALVPLSVQDREAMLHTLGNPPEGLAALRKALLDDHERRTRKHT